MRPLTPHAVVLGTIAALVLAWGPLGLALPDLDALLAPGGASLPSLLGTGALLLARTGCVLVLPGLTGVVLVDAALVLMERRGHPTG